MDPKIPIMTPKIPSKYPGLWENTFLMTKMWRYLLSPYSGNDAFFSSSVATCHPPLQSPFAQYIPAAVLKVFLQLGTTMSGASLPLLRINLRFSMSAVSFEDEDDEDEAVAAVDVDRSLEVQRRREEEEQEEESEDDEGGDEPFVQEMLGSSGSRGAIAGTSKPDINSELALGYKSGRSFVVRGNQIGVFRLSDDQNKLEFSTSIRQVGRLRGRYSRRRSGNSSSLPSLDPDNPNSLFKMDLEVGKVVEEWKVSDDIQIRNAVPTSKFAQMTSEPTLIGHGRNSVFKIDPRLSGLKMVDSLYKRYTTKQEFAAAITDEAGHLAVASDKGEIRLFEAIGKNVKTALPSIRDPIRGIDVTADGRYMVVTYKTYLLLIDTLISEGRYAGKLGFERSFPADAKPTPRRLQIRPENVAVMDQEISFTPARFNSISENSDETSIVTSTGHYIISWDFNQVNSGTLGEYKIRKLAYRIVQDAFAHGSDSKIIVAMENDVKMAKKEALKRPTRQSLPLTPRRLRSSKVEKRF
ncbi:unnamed protein product [Tilletia controversa]|nr:unnamed protein product [Tilletia controversa]